MIICGEGLVDLVPQNGAFTAALGGGPYNVAIAAARQGAQVRFISRLSTDTFGEQLVQTLAQEGIDTTGIQRGPEPTTLALTNIGPDGSATYTFYTEGTADRLANPSLSETPSIACFGTVSLALEPAASRYIELAKHLHSVGCFVALDPNIRPFYATESHKARLLDLIDHVDLLKLSEEEDEFLGHPTAPVKVITRGGEGLEVHSLGKVFRVSAPAIEVADTIGAGDTVMGAILAQLQAGATEWEEIAQHAANSAAVTCTRVGAQPPTKEEVKAFLASVDN